MSKILLVGPMNSRQSAIFQQVRNAGFHVDIAENHQDAFRFERIYGPFDFYVMSDKFPATSGKPLDTRVFMLAQDIHDRGRDYDRMVVISDSVETLRMAVQLGIPNTYRKSQIPGPSHIERDLTYLADDITSILTGGQTIPSTT